MVAPKHMAVAAYWVLGKSKVPCADSGRPGTRTFTRRRNGTAFSAPPCQGYASGVLWTANQLYEGGYPAYTRRMIGGRDFTLPWDQDRLLPQFSRPSNPQSLQLGRLAERTRIAR